MKDYREVARDVLERRDIYEAALRSKKNTLRKAAAWTTGIAGTAALCLAVLWGTGISKDGDISIYEATLTAQETDILPDSNNTLADNTNIAANHDAASAGNDSQETLPLPTVSEADNTDRNGGILPVSYSSLHLAQGQIEPEVMALRGSSQSAVDILPFDESMLSDCCAILEGTVTDMYLKEYAYDTYDDKFGTTEVYHNRSSSFVYELTVSKVWYGDQALTGTAVLIEDDTYLMDSYFSLKIGSSYCIPICDKGEQKYIWKDYAGGDLTRDSRYATLYPHHPQIEVTLDGDYVVTSDWETLCSGNAADIRMDAQLIEDVDSATLVEYHPENSAGPDGLITTEWRTLMVSAYDAVYYYDKMKLVEADEFFIQLNRLIDKLP